MLSTRLFRSPGLGVFLVVLGVYLLTGAGHLHTSDAAQQINVAESIVYRGTFEMTLEGNFPGNTGKPGKRYSHKNPGMSFLYLPAVLAGKLCASIYPIRTAHQFTTFFGSFLSAWTSALTCLVFYLMAAGAGGSRPRAALLSLVYAFSTIQWAYAHDSYDNTSATLMLMLSAYWLYLGCSRRSVLFSFLAGAAVGMGVLIRLDAALAPPFLFFYLLLSGWEARDGIGRRLAAFSIPLLGCVLGLVGFNYLRYGSAVSTGYEGHFDFGMPLLDGLGAYLISPGRSLFLYSPILLLSFLGLGRWFRSSRRECSFVLAWILAHLIFHSKFCASYAVGDWDWGPRFLVVLTPFLALPLVEITRNWAERVSWFKGLAFFLVGLGVAVQFLGIAIDHQLQVELLHETKDYRHRNWTLEISPVVLHATRLGEVLTGEAPYPSSRFADLESGRPPINTFDFWWVYMWIMGLNRPLVIGTVLLLSGATGAVALALLRYLRRCEWDT